MRDRAATTVGRALGAAIFISAALAHFSAAAIGNAGDKGVPLPPLAIPSKRTAGM